MDNPTIFSRYVLPFLGNLKSLGPSAYIGYVLGIIGLFLTWKSYVYGKKKVKLFSRTINLIQGLSSAYSDLEVYYRGEKQNNISVTKFVFWNSGRQPIRKQDIADKEPLRIQAFNNVKLLDVKLLHPKIENSNCLLLNKADNEPLKTCEITFDFLDQNEGFVVQTIHTGNKPGDVILLGKIIGLGNFPLPKGVLESIFLTPTTKSDRKSGIFFVCLFLIGSIYFLYITHSWFVFIIFGSLFCYCLVSLILHLTTKFPSFFEKYELD